MTTYEYIKLRSSPKTAKIITTIWYAMIIVLLAICWMSPQAEFRYGNL